MKNYSLLIVSILALVGWLIIAFNTYPDPTIVPDPNLVVYQAQLDSLKLQVASLGDSNLALKGKIHYYDSILTADSLQLILIKRRHEKELDRYRTMPVDSAFLEWVKLSRTR